MNRYVSLSQAPQSSPDSNGFFEALSPATAWCAIQPLGVALQDETRIQTSRVTMRFHPQVTIDTRIVYVDNAIGRTRELFVKSVQNTDDAGDELVLQCDEVWP